MNCPFISSRVRTDALLMLRNEGRREIKDAESPVMIEARLRQATSRQHKYLCLETSHFLVFGPRPLGESPAYTHSLLGKARGYDVETEHELNQVVRKLGLGHARDVLQVATLWSLSLGPGTCLQGATPFFHLLQQLTECLGVLITLCCMPLSDIRGDLIEVDDRASQGFYTIRVKLHGSEFCCHIVVDPDCSYVVGL
jgi:hypothetical protein